MTMSGRVLQHRRTHNLLLFQNHVNLQEASSPFTLILDNVEQPAILLLKTYIENAKVQLFFRETKSCSGAAFYQNLCFQYEEIRRLPLSGCCSVPNI